MAAIGERASLGESATGAMVDVLAAGEVVTVRTGGSSCANHGSPSLVRARSRLSRSCSPETGPRRSTCAVSAPPTTGRSLATIESRSLLRCRRIRSKRLRRCPPVMGGERTPVRRRYERGHPDARARLWTRQERALRPRCVPRDSRDGGSGDERGPGRRGGTTGAGPRGLRSVPRRAVRRERVLRPGIIRCGVLESVLLRGGGAQRRVEGVVRLCPARRNGRRAPPLVRRGRGRPDGSSAQQYAQFRFTAQASAVPDRSPEQLADEFASVGFTDPQILASGPTQAMVVVTRP